MKIKQTAGRKALGEFAPKFARLNDDVLFGDVWSGGEITLRERSVVTVVSLMAQGLCVTKGEIAEILTHAAFYCGWSKAWAAFNLAKDVWKEENPLEDAKCEHANRMIFPIGEPNNAYRLYFIERTGRNFQRDF